jgi:hypothetical protein
LPFSFLGEALMREDVHAGKDIPDSERAAKTSGALPEKVRYGAPDGPRQKRRERYDGREPLDYPGHEAVAQFLAAPTSDAEFESLAALANHFNVTRMTVHRWKQDIEVLQRAYWLSMHHQIAGDLVARRKWPQIMEKATELAEAGDVQAMKFCEARAWPQELRVEHSQVSTTVSFKGLFGVDEGDEPKKLQRDNRPSEGEGR